MSFNCRSSASSEPSRVLASSNRLSASALPAALSASVALAFRSWTWISCSRSAAPQRHLSAGASGRGPRLRLGRMTSSSNLAAFDLDPLPLAMTLSAKRSAGLPPVWPPAARWWRLVRRGAPERERRGQEKQDE